MPQYVDKFISTQGTFGITEEEFFSSKKWGGSNPYVLG